MRISIRLVALSATFVASTLIARADTYSFVISTGSTSTTPGTTFSVSGTLTGTPDPAIPGTIDLTSISGSSQGYGFTGIVPVGSNDSFTYDNLVYTDSAANHVDGEGVLLDLTSPIGTSLAHVFFNDGYHVDVIDPNDPGDITPFSIDTFSLTPTPSTVPEPSTFLLLGTGALGLLGAIKRKFLHQ